MFPRRYFAGRYFAPRYWPPVDGGAPPGPATGRRNGPRFIANVGTLMARR